MTFNCRFETPCGWCEKFDKECKEVCGVHKNERFKPQNNNSPMESIEIVPLSTVNIKTGKLER